jgi:hypothetical protein
MIEPLQLPLCPRGPRRRRHPGPSALDASSTTQAPGRRGTTTHPPTLSSSSLRWGWEAPPRTLDAIAPLASAGRRGMTTHPPTLSRSTSVGTATFPRPRWTQSPPLKLRPPWADYPSTHPLKVHRPRDHQLPPDQLAQAPPRELRPPWDDDPPSRPLEIDIRGDGHLPPSALTQSPPRELRPPLDDYPSARPLEIQSSWGRQPPPGPARCEASSLVPAIGPGTIRAPPPRLPAAVPRPMQTPCGSAVLAPSAVEPSWPATSFPPRRSAPRKLLAELHALDHHLVEDGALHPARQGWPPWSLRPA